MILEPSIWLPIVSAPFQFVPLDRMHACKIDSLAKLVSVTAADSVRRESVKRRRSTGDTIPGISSINRGAWEHGF